MVDTGGLADIFADAKDVTAVMESVVRLSDNKLTKVSTELANDGEVKDQVRCGYLKSADLAERFVGVPLNPDDRDDPNGHIVGPGRIFSAAEFDGDNEFVSSIVSVSRTVKVQDKQRWLTRQARSIRRWLTSC